MKKTVKALLLVLAGGFSLVTVKMVFQYREAHNEALIANKEKSCLADIERGSNYVKRSRILTKIRDEGTVTPGVRNPGINRKFVKGKDYVIIPQQNSSTLPQETVVYDSPLFRALLKTRANPSPILVKGYDYNPVTRTATVVSDCSPKKLKIKLDELYETHQIIIDDAGNRQHDVYF